jgi:hypothetical protein
MCFLERIECELDELDAIVTEVVARKTRRVRGGKVVRKRKCPRGFKVQGTRCVRQKSRERITRRRAGRKASRKGKAARKRTFKRSIRLRQRRKLKRQKFK